MAVADCPDCTATIAVTVPPGAHVKHNADGTHTIVTPTPPKARTDPKPRGRRRG